MDPALYLVLASASPRRVALLHQLGLKFEQHPSPEEEPAPGTSSPRDHALAAAAAKAAAVHGALRAWRRGSTAIVIGADTVVGLDDGILGKPRDTGDAAAMLQSLSGRRHEVFTGIFLKGPGDREAVDCVRTEVRMRTLSAEEIECYVESGEPMDKAGSYAIQGRGARFVESINGCYYNVVGLPIARLSAMLEELGFDFSSCRRPPSADATRPCHGHGGRNAE